MQGFVRLKVVFTGHAPKTKPQPTILDELLDRKPESPICTNALRMAKEFQKRCYGSDFKVHDPSDTSFEIGPCEKEGISGKLSADVIVPKPGNTDSIAWYDELNRKVEAFEDEIGAAHKTLVYLEDMTF